MTPGDLIYGGLERTQALALEDLKHKTMSDLLLSATEELGELACEVKIAHGIYGSTYKQPGEGPKAEAVDLVISALAVFYGEGGTHSEFGKIMERKLDKWVAKNGVKRG